jgi:hypothetical protein
MDSYQAFVVWNIQLWKLRTRLCSVQCVSDFMICGLACDSLQHRRKNITLRFQVQNHNVQLQLGQLGYNVHKYWPTIDCWPMPFRGRQAWLLIQGIIKSQLCWSVQGSTKFLYMKLRYMSTSYVKVLLYLFFSMSNNMGRVMTRYFLVMKEQYL